MSELPKQITQELWIGYDPRFRTPKQSRIYTSDMSKYGDVMLGTVTVTVDVPQDVDPIAKQIEALEAERARVQDEAQTDFARIDRRIAELQAIEYQPETES